MNPRPKSLISARAKKFIRTYSQQLFTNFYFKGTQQFLHDPLNKRWPSVTKPIMVGKTPCKLLCAFEVKVSNKLLAIGINFLALADIRALGL